MPQAISIITSVVLVIDCPLLTAPNNGDINCLLGINGQPSLGDTCTFTCDDGYEIGGSAIRVCQLDGSWSGAETTCTRGMYDVKCM